MKRLFSALLMMSMVLTLFQPSALAVGALSTDSGNKILTSAWDSDGTLGNSGMTSEQAEAYANIIKQAEARIKTVEVLEDIDEKAVYATLVNVDGSILLWLCGIVVYDREILGVIPFDVPYGDKTFWIVFEEMWEWDGTQAVQFNKSFSDYVYIYLRPDGLEFFTDYNGTDADGSVWDALYSFNNGKISSTPKWCRGWAYVDDYTLEELNINSTGKPKEDAEAYFKSIIHTGKWPTLPFDWDTITIADNRYDYTHIFRTEVTGGRGYQELYTSTDEYGISYDYPWIQLGLSEDSGILLSAEHIANHDERWVKAEDAINRLNAYSKSSNGGNTDYTYTDVTGDAWYFDAVKFVSKSGLMNGVGNGLFAPNDTLSRAMMAQILYNKAGKPAVDGTSAFLDVPDGKWCADAVIWAAANGVVNGYENGRFGPNDPVTREQLVVMIWRYEGKSTATLKTLNFSDTEAIGSWALGAMRWAVENGIINGKGNGILAPTGKATRAEVAQMLKNYLDK